MRVFAATRDGLWIDGRTELPGREVTALAPDDERIWAITDGATVRRRSASGRWTEIGSLDDLRANCLIPDGDAALVGTARAHLVRMSSRGAERVNAFDRAPARDAWYTPWGGPPDVRSIARDPAGTVFVNVHVGGILRGDDDTWTPTLDIDSDVHEVVATGGRVLAATAIGLAVSDDDGASWTFHTAGLRDVYMRSVAVAGDDVWVCAASSHAGKRAGLYRWNEEGFERAELPVALDDHVDTFCLRGAGERVIAGTQRGEVLALEDGSWRVLAEGLAPVTAIAAL